VNSAKQQPTSAHVEELQQNDILNDKGIRKNLNLTENSKEIDFFQAILRTENQDAILQQINSFASMKIAEMNQQKKDCQASSTWREVKKPELLKFIALTQAMSISRIDNVHSYFSDNLLFRNPWYQATMEEERFLAILQSLLHFGEPVPNGKSKVEPFIADLCTSFQSAFLPGQNLSVDEMIIGWRRSWKFKHSEMDIHLNYHTKAFGLLDSASGYVINLFVYYGDKEYFHELKKYGKGSKSVDVFLNLIQGIGTGHHIFANRYHTSMALIKAMLSAGHHYTGIIHGKRKGLPQQLKTLKMKHREHHFFTTEEKDILCLALQGKTFGKLAPIYLATTKGSATSVVHHKTLKPQVILDYKQNQVSWQKADKDVGYWSFHNRRFFNWWNKIFFWSLEIATCNAFVIFKKYHPKCKYLKFKKNLLEQLIESANKLEEI